MKCSVIIPTRNRSGLLAKLLNSILKQTLPQTEFEVLLVDNGSTDDTKSIVDSFQEKIKHLRYFFDEKPGLHVGRHIGLYEAQTEILVYCDDDIRAFPTWLEAISKTFEDPNVVLVGGKNLPDYETEPPIWTETLWNYTPWGKSLGYYSVLDFGDEIKEISPNYVWGCNFSIRKNILMDFGGFHPDSMPRNLIRYRGDGESAVSRLIEAKKLKTIYHPDASVYHWVSSKRMTKDYLYHRAFLQGISDSFLKIRDNSNSILSNPTEKSDLTIIEANVLRNKFQKIYDHITGRDIKREMKNLQIEIRNLQGEIRTIDSRLQSIQQMLNTPFDEIKEITDQGYLDGYKFHQRECESDPKLLAWVLKENYL